MNNIELKKLDNGSCTLGSIVFEDGKGLIFIDGYGYIIKSSCGYNDDCGSCTVTLTSENDKTTIEIPSSCTINNRHYQFHLWDEHEGFKEGDDYYGWMEVYICE